VVITGLGTDCAKGFLFNSFNTTRHFLLLLLSSSKSFYKKAIKTPVVENILKRLKENPKEI